MNEHETAFVNAFIVPEKRERYRTLLARKMRGKILDKLNHSHDVDERFMTRITTDRSEGALLKALKERGAGPNAYLIADSSDLDQRTMTLQQAISEVALEDFGVVVSCIPGRLALYKAENHRHYYLLQRPARS